MDFVDKAMPDILSALLKSLCRANPYSTVTSFLVILLSWTCEILPCKHTSCISPLAALPIMWQSDIWAAGVSPPAICPRPLIVLWHKQQPLATINRLHVFTAPGQPLVRQSSVQQLDGDVIHLKHTFSNTWRHYILLVQSKIFPMIFDTSSRQSLEDHQ